MGMFDTLIANLNSMGFYDFVLPWLFVFAVVYAILARTNVFNNNSVNGLVSMVIAFFVTGFGGPAIGKFFSSFFGGSSIFFAGFLVLILFAGMFGFKVGDKIEGKFLAVAALIAVVLFISWGGPAVAGINLSEKTQAILFVVVVMGAAIAFVTQKQG